MTHDESIDTDPKAVGLQLAAALGETAPSPRAKLEHIVQRLGVAYVHELLQETERLEAEGGVMVNDGTRRRTPGGTFFWLTRQRLENEGREEDLRALFPPRVSRRPPPIEKPPPVTQQMRPRKRGMKKESTQRRTSAINPVEALRRMAHVRPNQSVIMAVLDRHLGSPPDLHKRSFDPDTGAVTLSFHFPTIARQRYGQAIEEASREAGVPITISSRPHQEALIQVARSLLPAGLTLARSPSLLFDQQVARVICEGSASDADLQVVQEQFQTTTGWTLEILQESQDVQERQDAQERQHAVAAKPAAPEQRMEQQRALETVRGALGEDCYKVSVYPHTTSLTVRFSFPDVARVQYAELLDNLSRQTGWSIDLYPETHQEALAAAARHVLPATVEIIGSPSIYRDARQAAIRYQGLLTELERVSAEQAFTTMTGWQLILRKME